MYHQALLLQGFLDDLFFSWFKTLYYEKISKTHSWVIPMFEEMIEDDILSAPHELERLFERIYNEYAEWVIVGMCFIGSWNVANRPCF